MVPKLTRPYLEVKSGHLQGVHLNIISLLVFRACGHGADDCFAPCDCEFLAMLCTRGTFDGTVVWGMVPKLTRPYLEVKSGHLQGVHLHIISLLVFRACGHGADDWFTSPNNKWLLVIFTTLCFRFPMVAMLTLYIYVEIFARQVCDAHIVSFRIFWVLQGFHADDCSRFVNFIAKMHNAAFIILAIVSDSCDNNTTGCKCQSAGCNGVLVLLRVSYDPSPSVDVSLARWYEYYWLLRVDFCLCGLAKCFRRARH